MKKRVITNIIRSLEKISDDQYNLFKELKYLNFNSDNTFFGGSNFKVSTDGLGNKNLNKIYHITPMANRQSLINFLHHKIDNPQIRREINMPDFWDIDQLDEYIFGDHTDSYNRLSRFYEVQHKIHPEDFNKIFRSTFETSWKNYLYRYELRNTFKNQVSSGVKIMSIKEREFFNELPDHVTLFRVMSQKEADSKDYGISWTLNEEIAKEIGEHLFSNIWIPSGFSIKKLVKPKSDLFAYFANRQLEEIILT